jgi:Ca-activated chloride channel family protein
MTFAWPHLLWLLLAPAALFVWELTRHRRAANGSHPKILRAEAGAHHLSLVARPSPAAHARPWLAAGLMLALVAFARPQWGRLEEPVFDQSREILLAIDLSRSMLTPDVRPSRLDRAKLLTQSLLEKLAGERVGLVVFSGTAFLQCPLSADYEILREFLPPLGPAFMPEGGTNYGALLDTAIGAFGSGTSADRFLVILSDGEATDDDWRDRAAELKKKGIRVIGLGVGTAAGAMIPDGTGGLVKDDRGAVVLSKLESGTLRELADYTGGTYRDASAWIDLASVLNATVEAGRKGQFLEKNTVRLVERFQWPLALGLWFLLVSFYYEFPVRPKPRDIRLAASAVRAATALLVCLLAAMPAPARAVEDSGPVLGKIFSRLAYRDKLYAQDYAEIARETLRWGQRLKESGKPVTPGPVRDALQAVDQLIKIDSKIADWTKLRAELEALLEKPEEQKKDQQNQQDQQQQNQDQKNQDQQKQDSKSSPQNQQPQDQSQPQKKEQQSEDRQSKRDQSDGQKKPESAFGDMKQHEPPPPPKPQPGETQKVGGVPEKKESAQPADPALAVPLQKLDQLRNQDSPAELFQLMDADKKPAPKKKSKDW